MNDSRKNAKIAKITTYYKNVFLGVLARKKIGIEIDET